MSLTRSEEHMLPPLGSPIPFGSSLRIIVRVKPRGAAVGETPRLAQRMSGRAVGKPLGRPDAKQAGRVHLGAAQLPPASSRKER